MKRPERVNYYRTAVDDVTEFDTYGYMDAIEDYIDHLEKKDEWISVEKETTTPKDTLQALALKPCPDCGEIGEWGYMMGEEICVSLKCLHE